jgi:hypothetical protein
MELSPALVAKKIAGRTGSGDSSDSSIDIIENIDAIKSVTDLEEEEDKKKKAVDDPSSSDSSASTKTEEQVQEESSEADGGSIRFAEGFEPTGVDSKVGVSSNTSGNKKKKKNK